MTQTDSYTEVDLLGEMFSHELKCESHHVSAMAGDTFPCSGDVVARKIVSCEHRDFLICANSYRWNVAGMNSGKICSGCKELTADCWTVIPV